MQAEKMRAFQKPESEMGFKKARQRGKKMMTKNQLEVVKLIVVSSTTCSDCKKLEAEA